MNASVLEMKNISKRFPGVVALEDVNFNLQAGEIHALLGINGAGKSTLIKILSGVYQMDSGEIIMNGEPVEINNPQKAKELGISTVYQDPQMIPTFSGYENIYLGSESESRSVFRLVRRGLMRKKAAKLIEKFPFEVDIHQKVGKLSTIEKESIAILRVLARENTKILVLDEPTSILSRKEIDILFKQIDILKQHGIAIIYITHRLEEIFQIADRYTVLRDGKLIGTNDVVEGIDHNQIAEMMLGEKLSQVFPEKSDMRGEVLCRVDQLSLDEKFKDVNFSVRKGEIVGIYGLVGSGFDELCKAMFGILKPDDGRILINNQDVRLNSPIEALKNGIFLVPGDRRIEGQILDESVAFNITLANLDSISNSIGLVRRGHEKRDAKAVVETLNVKTSSTRTLVSKLSGGNQQKVVIGKGLYTNSDIYIFEEPTVGVDVGAKSSIYHLIRELSAEKAVIVASSDLEEVYGISDRVLVMYKGQVIIDKPVHQTNMEEMLICGLTGVVNGKNK
jgi:ribose transport system ATP-binding protein